MIGEPIFNVFYNKTKYKIQKKKKKRERESSHEEFEEKQVYTVKNINKKGKKN